MSGFIRMTESLGLMIGYIQLHVVNVLCDLPSLCACLFIWGEGLLTELSSLPFVFSTFYRMQVLMIDSEFGLAG